MAGSASFQLAKQPAKNVNPMKTETFKERLDRNHSMTTITIRRPADVIEDLKRKYQAQIDLRY